MQKLVITLRSTLHCLWVTALAALLVGGIAFVPDAAAQGGSGGSSGPQLTVLAEGLNVRSGPGVTYPTAGLLVRGDQAPLVGHHAASGWWQVQLPGGSAGWVSGGAAYVAISGSTAGLPEVAAPATAGAPSAAASPAPSTARKGGTIVFETSSGGDIFAVNANTLAGTGGTNLRRLTSGMDPALSPDGQRVPSPAGTTIRMAPWAACGSSMLTAAASEPSWATSTSPSRRSGRLTGSKSPSASSTAGG